MWNSLFGTVQDKDEFDSVTIVFNFWKNKLFKIDFSSIWLIILTSTSPSASGNRKFRRDTIVFSGIGPPLLAFLLPNESLLEESNP